MLQLVIDEAACRKGWLIQGANLSKQEYLAFCERNSSWRIERSAEGELQLMAPANATSSDQNSELNMQLRAWAKRDGTGLSFDCSVAFDLPDGSNRSPDASWVSKSRWDALPPDHRLPFPELCPDFGAEVRSCSDRLSALRAKMQKYVANGAQLGWLIDPIEAQVSIYRPGT